jgi:hypothetical protein
MEYPARLLGLLAVLQPDLCVGAYCWDLCHYYSKPSSSTPSCFDFHGEMQAKVRSYRTKLSSDISPLRSIGSGHSPKHPRIVAAEDLVHVQTQLPEQSPIYKTTLPRWQSDVYISRTQCGGNFGCSNRAELFCTSLFIPVAYKTFECGIQFILVADWLAASCF